MAIEQLRSNTLARLMPGSRELFHSNLLAWYFETMGEPARRTLAALAGLADPPSQISRIEREKNRFDLLILDDKARGVVIENKVFSIPRTEQLDEYSGKLRSMKSLGHARPVLLSLADPSWPDGRYESRGRRGDPAVVWHYVSYRRVAELMSSSIPSSSTSYEWSTVARYCALVETLSSVAEDMAAIEPESLVFPNFPSNQSDPFANQIYGSLRKLRADAVAQYVARTLTPSTQPRSTSSGMTNSQPIVETFYRRSNTKLATAVGWQLQGNQLRLFANIPTKAGRTTDRQNERVTWGIDNVRLFAFDFAEEVWPGESKIVKPATGFNRFDPAFIYRYINASGLTVGQLITVAQAHQMHLDGLSW
ncbi:PD-(D/E)XK nuclease family protein [Williamsia sp. M5A3_1d]